MVVNCNVAAAVFRTSQGGELADVFVPADAVVRCVHESPNHRSPGSVPADRNFVIVNEHGNLLGREAVDMIGGLKERVRELEATVVSLVALTTTQKAALDNLTAVVARLERENKALKAAVSKLAALAWGTAFVAVGACCMHPRAAVLLLPASVIVAAVWRRSD